MAKVPQTPHHTSSDGVRSLFQPLNSHKPIPSSSLIAMKPQQQHQFHPQENAYFPSWGKPDYEPLLRPSAVRAHLPTYRDTEPMPRETRSWNFETVLPPNFNGMAGSAPVQRESRYPVAKLSRSQTALSTFPARDKKQSTFFRRATQSARREKRRLEYNPLTDPHLRNFYDKRRPINKNTAIKRPPAEAEYQIEAKTGALANAGTTARVFIRLFGRRGNLQKIRLANTNGLVMTHQGKKFLFEPESLKSFICRGKNIGTLSKIIIEHDGLHRRDGWFLEFIRITTLADGATYYFPCFQWLSLYEHDCQISRELLPLTEDSAKEGATTTFEIETLTGDQINAGTDAHVFVTLFGGKNRHTPRMQLSKSDRDENAFEKGCTDKFFLQASDVGKLTKLRIEHDNTGRMPGWYLKRVTVKSSNLQESVIFPCEQWLAKNEGDGRISRDLFPSKDMHNANHPYSIHVSTGDKRGAGTDANVFLTMFGSEGDSGEFQLKKSGNNFERNNDDVFECQLPHLGVLKTVRIRHDNTGLAPGWYLDSIIVNDVGDGKSYEFPCKRWLSKDEDDGQISRDLVCSSGNAKQKETLVPFEITLKTGDKIGAGTDAKAFVELHAVKEDRSSGKIFLDDQKLVRGKTCHASIELSKDFSPTKYLTVGHDNSGAAPGWFLEKAVIYCPSTGIEQHFLCNKWLATDEEDGVIIRDLQEVKEEHHVRDKMTPWDAIVYTSDIKNAGTDADVFMVVYGEHGKSDEIALKNNSDKFERGAEDHFLIETPELGQLYKIRIGHNNNNAGSAWHLAKVEMTHRTSQITYHFLCNRWLATDEDDGEISRELPASGSGINKPLAVIKYDVQVYTGDRRGAGTNANVYCTIFGAFGDTGIRWLRKSSSHQNKFESQNVDKFMFEAVDLGQLKMVRIGHDNNGQFAGWFLEKVVVSKGEKQAVEFPCQRWLADDEDDGKIERDLFSQNHKSVSNTVTYKVHVKTADVRNGGTDANVYCTVFGEKGDTGKLYLKKTISEEKPSFERGKMDSFQIECADLGIVKRLLIGHDNSGIGAAWFLEEVTVEIPSQQGAIYKFPCYRWLAKDEEDGQIELMLHVDKSENSNLQKTDHAENRAQKNVVPYEITVKTGDIKHAGTNATVFLQIFGTAGFTEEYKLKNKTDNFERGKTDAFKIEGTDVGRITKIRIGHDDAGFASGWFLDSVKIAKASPTISAGKTRSPSSSHQETSHVADHIYWFDCQKWFSTSDGDGLIVRELTPSSKAPSTAKPPIDSKHTERAPADSPKPINEIPSASQTRHPLSYESRSTSENKSKHATSDVKPDSGKEKKYEIHTYTSSTFGAGTDANVFINLIGDKAQSGEVKLEKSQNRNKFEKGQMDSFQITAADCGTVRKVQMRHDNTGTGPGWHLDRVDVVDISQGVRHTFPCKRWLSTNDDDGQICRTLSAVEESKTK